MEQIFISLTRAVEGSIPIALLASLIWGVLSIVLSPCHLSSIPLIVGFVSEQESLTRRKALGISSLFALGILITIAMIGMATSAMGRMMGDVGRYGNYFVAIIFFLVGLHLIGLIPMPWPSAGQAKMRRKGYSAAFLLGLLFGIALGPCTFAYMAPMLAVSFKVASSNPIYAVALLLAYGVGHGSVIVFAGASTELIQRYLNWSEGSKAVSVIKKVCGFLVFLGGIYMIYTAN